MSKQMQVTWAVLLDDAEWDRDGAIPGFPLAGGETAPAHVQAGRRRIGAYLIGLLLLVGTAAAFWQQTQSGLAAVDASLTHTLALESQANATGDDLLAAALLDPQTDAGWQRRTAGQMLAADASGSASAEIVDFVLQGHLAMAQVRVIDAASGAVFRESRFYRETADGWLRSQPQPSLWGSPQTLESEHFVFHFRQRDGAAVAQVAPLLDDVWLHIHTTLGLPLRAAPGAEAKVQVHIAAGGEGFGALRHATGQSLWVHSPELARLPESVSKSRALAELVASSLRPSLLYRAAAPQEEGYRPTAELLNGLRLWLAWEEGTLLADYRRELVGWLYASAPGSPGRLPSSYLAMCGLSEAGQIAAPLLVYCSQPPPAPLLQWSAPTELRHLPLTVYPDAPEDDGGWNAEYLLLSQQIRSIAFATLLEYVTRAYGQGSVVALLRAAGEGQEWRTIAPTLFGVSAAKFEAGWQAWLTAEYGGFR